MMDALEPGTDTPDLDPTFRHSYSRDQAILIRRLRRIEGQVRGIDHVQGCVRTAAEKGEADRYIEEVLDVVRRTLGKPVRGARV